MRPWECPIIRYGHQEKAGPDKMELWQAGSKHCATHISEECARLKARSNTLACGNGDFPLLAVHQSAEVDDLEASLMGVDELVVSALLRAHRTRAW